MSTISGIGLNGLGLGLNSGFLAGGTIPLGKRFDNTIGAYSLQDIGANGGAVVDVFDGASTTVSYTASQIANGDHASGASSDRFVSKWYDQSGSGNHLVQSSNSDQPLICDSSGNAITNENGDYAIYFNPQGSGTRHFIQSSTGYYHKSVFVVGDPLNNNAVQSDFCALNGRNASSGSYIFIAGTGVSYAISVDGSVGDVGTWYQNGASGVNGTNLGNTGDILHNTTALQSIIFDSGDPLYVSYYIGRFGSSTPYYWRGSMTEVIIYDDYKNDDRVAIRDDINTRYNLF